MANFTLWQTNCETIKLSNCPTIKHLNVNGLHYQKIFGYNFWILFYISVIFHGKRVRVRYSPFYRSATDFSVLFFNAFTFASDKFGWSSARTDEVLLPVLKQLNKDEVGTFQASKSYVNVPSILIQRPKQTPILTRGCQVRCAVQTLVQC